MATREQVRDAMHQQPSRGITLELSDGRTFFIEHPNFIGFPAMERGQDKTVDDREGTHFLDGDLLPIAKVASQDPGEAKPKRKAGRK